MSKKYNGDWFCHKNRSKHNKAKETIIYKRPIKHIYS